MNAVEAVEQLAALGRRVLQSEGRLQQPVAGLRPSPLWQWLLADPLAAVGIGAQAGVKESGEQEPGGEPLAHGRGLDGGNPSLTVGALAEDNGAPTGSLAGNPSLTVGALAEDNGAPTGSSAGNPSLTVGALAEGERAPARGVRLAREQSALLSILNANLSEPAPGPRRQAAPAQGLLRATVEPLRPGARAAPGEDAASVASEDVGGERAPGPGGQALAPARRPQREAGGAAGSRPQDEQQPAAQAMPPALRAAGGLHAAPERAGEERPPLAAAAPSALDPLAAGPRSADGFTRSDWGQAIAPADDGALFGGDEFTPARADPLADTPRGPAPDLPPAPAAAEQPLSTAQVEQVLAALDERLELLLLRMYGAAGSP